MKSPKTSLPNRRSLFVLNWVAVSACMLLGLYIAMGILFQRYGWLPALFFGEFSVSTPIRMMINAVGPASLVITGIYGFQQRAILPLVIVLGLLILACITAEYYFRVILGGFSWTTHIWWIW